MKVYFLKIKFHKKKWEFSYFIDEIHVSFDTWMAFVKNKITERKKIKTTENKTFIIRTLKLEV